MIAAHAVGELVVKKHEAWWEYFLTENQESVAQLHFVENFGKFSR